MSSPWSLSHFVKREEDLGNRPAYIPPAPDLSFSFMHNATSGRARNVLEGPHPGVHCGECKLMLGNSIRYACLDCVDFDLCQVCEADGVIRMKHANGQHVFAKVRNTNALGGNAAIAKFRK